MSDLPAHERFPNVFAPPEYKPPQGGGGAASGGGATTAFDPPRRQRGEPTRADKIALGQLKGGGSEINTRTLNWSIYTVAELVRFRDEIGRHLPALELAALNLEEEALLQYHTLRELQGQVMGDGDVPVNQRAQVANSVAATLRTLGDQQIALYSSERFKMVENLLIRTLDKLPEELAAAFITEYERLLTKT